jgi:transposase
MVQKLAVTTERVDDIPILLASEERMGVAELLDRHYETHGGWEGISFGKTMSVWLAHILHEGDHRLNHVEEWAGERMQTLRSCLGEEVRALDLSDDRLAQGLDLLGKDESWGVFEAELNGRILRVYDLNAEGVRIDTTTGSGYWEVTEGGLFQFGHSKDHRPDLPQVKVVLSVLDPLGMPLATQVVGGSKADDPLYIPAIDQVRAGVGKRGLLYIGDCKMMSLGTRTYLVQGGDAYLGPFSAAEVTVEELEKYLEPVWSGKQALNSVKRREASGKLEKIAEGYECGETMTALVDGETVSWVERRLILHSFAHAQAAERGLKGRLEKAHSALLALTEHKQGKEPFADAEKLRQAAEAILKQRDVQGLLTFQVTLQTQERHLRKYGDRPAETRTEALLTLMVQRDEIAIQNAIRCLGWRVYGTNRPKSVLSLQQAVLAYRDEYLVEHCFGRLKGKPLSLTPMYLQDDRRATGLIRLLSIGLRVLTLLEHVARSHIQEQDSPLPGLYAGNPTRSTRRPTTEAMLRAFENIDLSVVTLKGQTYHHITPLSKLQRRILALLDLPASIYTRLGRDSQNPP